MTVNWNNLSTSIQFEVKWVRERRREGDLEGDYKRGGKEEESVKSGCKEGNWGEKGGINKTGFKGSKERDH